MGWQRSGGQRAPSLPPLHRALPSMRCHPLSEQYHFQSVRSAAAASAVGTANIPTLGRPVVPLVNMKLARSSLHRAAKGSQTWHTERTAPAPAMKRARHSQPSTSSCALRIGHTLHYLCSSGGCQAPLSTILRPCTAIETTHHCKRCQRTVQLCRQVAWGHGPCP